MCWKSWADGSHLFGEKVRPKWTLITFNQRTFRLGLVTALMLVNFFPKPRFESPSWSICYDRIRKAAKMKKLPRVNKEMPQV